MRKTVFPVLLLSASMFFVFCGGDDGGKDEEGEDGPEVTVEADVEVNSESESESEAEVEVESGAESEAEAEAEGEDCDTKLDADLIRACYGTISTGGTLVGGSAGATDPGATVTVYNDTTGDNTTRTAGDDGSFAAPIPAAIGTTLRVVAEKEGCEPTEVTVVVVRCP